MGYKILEIDSLLGKYYERDINLRMDNYNRMKTELLTDEQSLTDFANGAEYFGIHKTEGGWVYREWAPAAEAMFFMGDFNGWNKTANPMKYIGNGVFEVFLEGENTLWNGCKVKAVVLHQGQMLERIPLYAKRVVQDPGNYVWSAEVYETSDFVWSDEGFKAPKTPYIYECHIGMAQEKQGLGTYKEFKDFNLPRIKELGYNTIQIMAVMEHVYYGSFGYQVSNFFAASSKYGTPDELKELINTAHDMGIQVLLDVVHSHAVRNTAEGLNEFDGTVYQFFHAGGRGDHSAWGTKLFDYGKHEVIHFLLSNLKFWMTEYHFDGFRFDGVTSMLYHDHGLGTAFDHYDKYFSLNTDTEAVTYLQLANELIHEVNPNAVTIAEDMSGMPGMCLPIPDGGIGFDYRLAMGTPDMWVRMVKDRKDEDWDLWNIYYELTGRRPQEKVIGYVESHDQALVGDKTMMFRLCDSEMYYNMDKASKSLVIDRGIALHKMIRLLTASLGGEGYLNFMGNEFGHPEWIDFPREGNNWSYFYCRRQWSLVDNPELKYGWLNQFDQAMLSVLQKNRVLSKGETHNLWIHQGDMVMIYERNGLLFIFGFHPSKSFSGYFIPVTAAGEYKVILSTDTEEFGGFNRVATNVEYATETLPDGRTGFLYYIPSRTAVVMKRIIRRPRKKAEPEVVAEVTAEEVVEIAEKTTGKKTAKASAEKKTKATAKASADKETKTEAKATARKTSRNAEKSADTSESETTAKKTTRKKSAAKAEQTEETPVKKTTKKSTAAKAEQTEETPVKKTTRKKTATAAEADVAAPAKRTRKKKTEAAEA